MNQFPPDFRHALSGFGGDPLLDRAAHRARRRRCPVILVHGNASHSADPRYGMLAMRGFLKDAGYEDIDIWALDYLGENNERVVLNGAHRDHIGVFREFVDAVRAYLDAGRMDFIAHSLGCGMVNAWLRGLQPNGLWNHGDHRFDAAGTFVSIAGAQYGLGRHSIDEFRTGGSFEIMSHGFGEVAAEDTPFGCREAGRQVAPREDWVVTSTLDDDQVCYVAIIAREDFVDQQYPDTSRRNGADLNKVFNVGPGAAGHERIVKDPAVFDAFKGFLNRSPPVPPVRLAVDKDSGNYGPDLEVTLSVTPPDAAVSYHAERLTKEVQAGFLVTDPVETRGGYLADGQSLVLDRDGAWDLRFTAASGAPLERTYGVKVEIPLLEILTGSASPFQGSLEVRTRATKGTVYHSQDKTRWLAESNPTIHDTTTLHFIAIDADGLCSAMLSGTWEKKAPEFVKASLTEHFVAGRIDVKEYIDLTLQLGAFAVITLYRIGGEWVRDPDTPEAAPKPPALAAGAASAAAPPAPAPAIRCTHPSGSYAAGFDTEIAAPSGAGPDAVVYYTEDGSDPADAKNPNRKSFEGSKRFSIRGNGRHALLCYAKDAQGKDSFASFGWRIDDHDYPETRISPASGGSYAGPVRVALSVDRPCAWTRYTLDGSEPTAEHGATYAGPIELAQSAQLRFRSLGLDGKLEPSKSASFRVGRQLERLVFESDTRHSGYLAALPERGEVLVGTGSMLHIGAPATGPQAGRDCRAILHFDTAALPDNVAIRQAFLELPIHLRHGEAPIELDVQRGHFGSCSALRAGDWDARASAEGVARIDGCAAGLCRSTDFSEAGLAAIDRTGSTEIRLRMAHPGGEECGACLLLDGGEPPRLVLSLASLDR